MTVRPAADVREALQKKGMTPGNSHHTMFVKDVDGVVHLVTRVSHSATDLDDHLLALMGHQCALQLKEFVKLVDCTLTESDWDELVRTRCPDGRNPFLPNR